MGIGIYYVISYLIFIIIVLWILFGYPIYALLKKEEIDLRLKEIELNKHNVQHRNHAEEEEHE